MRVVTFKIREELLDELDNLAIKIGVPRSEVIREAIKEYIKKKKRTPPLRIRRVVIS